MTEQELYLWKTELPLKYNTYDLRSLEERTSEIVFGLKAPLAWTEAYTEINIDQNVVNRIDFRAGAEADAHNEENTEIRLALTCEKEDEKLNIPQKYFKLQIENIPAFSEEDAGNIARGCIDKICKALSLAMNSGNCNKQGYQPRVWPDCQSQKWSKKKYISSEEALEAQKRENKIEIIDGRPVQIVEVIVPPLEIKCLLYTKIFSDIPAEDFYKYYSECGDYKADYIASEFYAALGEENMSSKFFHLISIIEFVEHEYSEMSGAQLLLAEDEKKCILDAVELCGDIDRMKKARLADRIKNIAAEMTDIGRNEKLLNILHGMGIYKLEITGECVEVNKSFVKEITDMRNTYFHGKQQKCTQSAEKRKKSLARAVTELMWLCTQIIEFTLSDKKVQ